MNYSIIMLITYWEANIRSSTLQYHIIATVFKIQSFKLFVCQIPDLRSIIRENVLQTPCCDSSVPLNECCIGVYQCPECAAEYRYSWCSADLCAEENRPRNHCAVCKTCRDHKDVHCSVCKHFSS